MMWQHSKVAVKEVIIEGAGFEYFLNIVNCLFDDDIVFFLKKKTLDASDSLLREAVLQASLSHDLIMPIRGSVLFLSLF